MMTEADYLIAELISALAGELGEHDDWRSSTPPGTDPRAEFTEMILRRISSLDIFLSCPQCHRHLRSGHAQECDWVPF